MNCPASSSAENDVYQPANTSVDQVAVSGTEVSVIADRLSVNLAERIKSRREVIHGNNAILQNGYYVI